MIRESEPGDTEAIIRLSIAQYRRTPWPLEGVFHPVSLFHVCERQGRISACLGYRHDVGFVHVMHVWAEDGFGGRRSAVELMKDMAALADATGVALVFDTMPENVGLQAAVEEHGCQSTFGGGAVHYRRKATTWAVQA